MTFDATTLLPGERAYVYVWAGGDDAEPVLFTVVRVNRRTVTGRLEGTPPIERRIKHEDVVGRVALTEIRALPEAA